MTEWPSAICAPAQGDFKLLTIVTPNRRGMTTTAIAIWTEIIGNADFAA